MPNRILRDSIRTSESLALLTGDEERHFYRLLVAADDYGRFDARTSVILGTCYSLMLSKISIEQVAEWTQRLAEPDIDIIRLYEVDGKRYGVFVNWLKYQTPRAVKSKWPEPPDTTCTQMLADENILVQSHTDSPVFVSVFVSEDVSEGVAVAVTPAADTTTPTAAAAIPEWLTVISELQQPTPEDLKRLKAWAKPHEETVLRETAYALVEKWPGVKKKYSSPFSAFQGWVRVAEDRESKQASSRAPPQNRGRAARAEPLPRDQYPKEF